MALLIADLYEVSGVLRRWGEAIAAGEGQTQSRWQVLSVVSEVPMTVPSAARRLGISRQAVQRTANELVDDGLARLTPNPDHRTSPLLELTEAGREVLARITRHAALAHRTITAQIPQDDMVRTRVFLHRLLEQLAQRTDMQGEAGQPGTPSR
jgi:DNA-binding MarR family transcriptional regulator